MAWSDAARQAAMAVRKMHTSAKARYASSAGVRKVITKSANATYRGGLAQEIARARRGEGKTSEATMLRAIASSIGKRRAR